MTLTIVFLVLAAAFVFIGIKFVKVMKNAKNISSEAVENARIQREAQINKHKAQSDSKQSI